jgi:plasmid stabilization system protein ParE
MILRWTAGALADLESIYTYQKLHWPAMLASFEARLTASERRIIEFPLSAPEIEQRPASGLSRSAISPIGSSIAPKRTRSTCSRSATRRAGRRLNERRRRWTGTARRSAPDQAILDLLAVWREAGSTIAEASNRRSRSIEKAANLAG